MANDSVDLLIIKYCTTMNIEFCELNGQRQPQKLLFESTYINETMVECFEFLKRTWSSW